MPPLLDDSEIRQLLEDISAAGAPDECGELRRVSVIVGECSGDQRRVSVIQVEETSEAPGSCAHSWLDTSILTSYAYSLIQLPVYAVNTLIVIPLANISTKIVGEERMQSAISILQRLSFLEPKEPELEGCATLLRDLILSQEKTMFYTMTMASTPKSTELVKKPMPNLKWKCALSLSRSQTVIHRANSNSNSYYTFTYLGDYEVDANNPPGKGGEGASPKDCLRSVIKKGKEPSPVKIYINS